MTGHVCGKYAGDDTVSENEQELINKAMLSAMKGEYYWMLQTGSC